MRLRTGAAGSEKKLWRKVISRPASFTRWSRSSRVWWGGQQGGEWADRGQADGVGEVRRERECRVSPGRVEGHQARDTGRLGWVGSGQVKLSWVGSSQDELGRVKSGWVGSG